MRFGIIESHFGKVHFQKRKNLFRWTLSFLGFVLGDLVYRKFVGYTRFFFYRTKIVVRKNSRTDFGMGLSMKVGVEH